jgi:hypothetical protein
VEINTPDNGNERLLLREVVESLLTDLKSGAGDRDKRRHVEEWMKSLSEKYPDFGVEEGLREYYLAEAKRLRGDFDGAKDLTERLNLGRSVEGFLEKAADYERRIRERGK